MNFALEYLLELQNSIVEVVLKVQGVNSYPISVRFNSPKAVKNVKSGGNFQKNEISNVYYQPLNFTRRWSEHKSWGGVVNPKTKDVTFKLFSFPDNKAVHVEITNSKNGKTHTFEMKQGMKKNGIYESDVISKKIAHHGDSYRFVITKANGEIEVVKDPYSQRQQTLLGESALYDHSLYKWNDKNWYQTNPLRVSRLASKNNGLTPVSSLRIYELNTKTLTKKGTFDGVKDELERIKKLGFNAIEIMPVENTYSFNWGYDGVDKFAPAQHLGGPDGLKSLVNYAHSIGMNVIMDMVPNHIGPDGNALYRTGPYIKGPNAFGDAINFEGENSEYVRDFIVNSAINWIDNYHCDGLRLDMTKFMESDFTMKQIAAEVNYHFPDTFLIAEDGRANIKVDESGNSSDSYTTLHDERVARPLKPWEYGGNSLNAQMHEVSIDRISNRDSSVSLSNLGYDSEWDFAYFHQLKETLYNNVDLDKLFDAMNQSQNRVKYVMSHDEIGNYDGTRLVAKLMVPMLSLNDNIILNDTDRQRASDMSRMKNRSYDDCLYTVKSQKTQLASEKLVRMFLEGKLDKYETSNNGYYWLEPINPQFIKEVLEPIGIDPASGTCPEKIKEMYMKSFSLCKTALASTYSTPGPKMVFQGDESLDITPFRFFREFQSIKDDAKNLQIEKGYNAGISAMKESTLGNINYSSFANEKLNQYSKLCQDLNVLASENPAMTDGHYVQENIVKHHQSKVLATHSISNDGKNEIYTITNFENAAYPRQDADKYYITFPEGAWVEVLNTDDKKYGGVGYVNRTCIISDGKSNKPVNLGKYSTMIFKKIA